MLNMREFMDQHPTPRLIEQFLNTRDTGNDPHILQAVNEEVGEKHG